MHTASEQASTAEAVIAAHDDVAPPSSDSLEPSSLASAVGDETATRPSRPYVPLFWRVLALNAAVVTTMAVAIAIVLPAPFAHIASDDAAILAVTLAVTLIANALLLRNALAPLTHLPSLLRRVDPLQSGERLQVPSAPSEAAELAHAYNEMLDELESERLQSTRRALSAQESERLRVAQELHDEVGQTLTGILLGLSRASKVAPAELALELEQLLETTRASIGDVRRIAQRLRPETLEDLGLTGALQALSRRLREHSDLHIRCRIPDNLPSQSAERELVVYRVAQEAMTNAIRHAQASSIDISLRANANRLALSVRDDGLGMSKGSREGGGMRGMRERANLVGGSFQVLSAPRSGTEVRLEIPLNGEIKWLR
ncbi:MAG TPA: sensor histidine kinase [Solirubrobacteraceae bacterium]|nr:sensor histidine kinase [Solirubrobacteraceae bacterium]